jgi:outer membrane protein OmpU
MKKLLLSSAAVMLGLAVAGPAKADGIKLDLAGHFKGYVTWLSQDSQVGTDERHFDILRETEIHFTGETTLDNGLTVGVHHEADIDSEYGGTDVFTTEESYAYFSGAWGRVNFGKEDGANYLLQVAAPSADENYDGLRQYINPENIFLTDVGNFIGHGGAGGNTRGFVNSGKLDYANDATGYANKITYLTPVWSGFQAGASYTPSMGGFLSPGGNSSFNEGSTAFGVPAKSNTNLLLADNFGDAWEGALRYEGKWQELGITLGGGYTHVRRDNQTVGANTDDFNQWNLGGGFSWQQFGLGVVYTKDNGALNDNGDNRTWVVGVDYTTGPFKIGGSYLNNHEDLGTLNGQLDTTRWAGGVVYTYGPGMTFRGSVGWVRSDLPDEQGPYDDSSISATDVLLGTQINF